MRTSGIVATLSAISTLVFASPLACTNDCTSSVSKTKTHYETEKSTITVTKTIFTKNHVVTASGTSTLSPACPTSSSLDKRAVTTPAPTSTVSAACACKHTKTTHFTTTITTTKTKTRTETFKTSTTLTTHTATTTPSLFYLQSSIDDNLATPDNSMLPDYLSLTFSPCDSSSALFSLNTTTNQLTHYQSGWVADNAAEPGATGEIVAFSSLDWSNGYQTPTPLVCALDAEQVLTCGQYDSDEVFELCGGELAWSRAVSHLCDEITVKAVQPSWV